MDISIDKIKELREKSGAGIMECRNALFEATGEMEKALQLLKQKNLIKADKKKDRKASQGLIDAYIHTGGRIGAIVEVNCETDFAARTNELKDLTHELAMQVAAQDPQFITREEVPEGSDIDPQAACLLLQAYIRNPTMTIQDVINETIARVGENIKISRFARFALSE